MLYSDLAKQVIEKMPGHAVGDDEHPAAGDWLLVLIEVFKELMPMLQGFCAPARVIQQAKRGRGLARRLTEKAIFEVAGGDAGSYIDSMSEAIMARVGELTVDELRAMRPDPPINLW